MPKSKRNQVVSLTKTKKGVVMNKKEKLIEKVHSLIDSYKYVFSISFKNITTLAMQSLRDYFREEQSEFFLGKSTVLAYAVGKSEEDSYKPLTYKLSSQLKGNCGLFFSNKDPKSIIDYFSEYTCPHFAMAGQIGKSNIVIKRGCPVELKKFPSSMETQFRELGLKFKLDGGKFYVLEDFVCSKEGEKLTSNQAQMLRILDIREEEFKIKVTSYCDKKSEYVLVDEYGFNDKTFTELSKEKKGEMEFDELNDDNDEIMDI